MLRKFLTIVCFLPVFALAQQSKDGKCKDMNRGIDQLPCKIVSRYGIDLIPDESTTTNYVDILIKKDLLDPEKAKPYEVSLIEDGRVWHIIVKSYNCRNCKINININKNTGEVLNYYKSEN